MFSSCCIVKCNSMSGGNQSLGMESNFGSKVYCGSHDKHVYCWNQNHELEWKSQKLDSEIYSIPFVAEVKLKAATETSLLSVVFVSTTSGHTYVLKANNGHVLGKLTLPLDVFSSPVVCNNHIVVGCRDDYVYCSQLKVTYAIL